MPANSSQSHQFVVEAREHLASMTAALIAIERGGEDPRMRVEQLLRSAHSIKGGAGFTGRAKIEQLAHSIETAFENIRDGHLAATPEAIDTLLGALDRIGGMIDDLEHSDETDISELLTRIERLNQSPPPPPSAIRLPARPPSTIDGVAVPQASEFPVSERVQSNWQQGGAFLYGVKLDWFACERDFDISALEVARRLEQAGTVLDSRFDLVGPSLKEGLPAAPLWYRAIVASELDADPFAKRLNIPCAAIIRLEGSSGRTARVSPAPPPAESRPRPAAAATSLRISVPLIDRMMELAGELALVRNQAVRSTDPANAPLRRLMRRLDSVTDELQDAALRMRMQPVSNLFDRFPRLVRDLARQLGKEIEIEISGSEVELDKTVLEILADPLTHLIRNCCDHGIEMPDQRTSNGKSPAGLIRLSARQDRGQIVIEVRDDGKGLDPAAIKRKAIEQGIKRAHELDALSERQLYDLILLSGFSTASKVTDLSGRGVGMDVVKTNLDQAGGFVEIDSAVGRGSIFTLRLPLTLAIMPCLLVTTGDERYAIPQRDLEEVVLLEPNGKQQIECTQDEEVLRLRGTLVPIVRLHEVLSRREPLTSTVRATIIARYHPPQTRPRRQYVAILRVGSHRFGLVVDDVLESEDIVVKPLHPLLRQLGVFGAATILGDGGVALILSGDGIARYSGILHRPVAQSLPAPQIEAAARQQSVMLFRYGPAELLAMPLDATRRVVAITPGEIEHVGERELVNIDGVAINVLRLDRILNLSACQAQDRLFLILPRASTSFGLLASEIVDTPTLPIQLDAQAYKVDGMLGTAMVRGQIAVFIDLDRLLEIWHQMQGSESRRLPDASRRRILVVEDTQFFQKLITSHLEGEEFSVTLAENGQAGLDVLATGEFDLIISDIEMPVMDGFTFARRVREQPRFAAIPMVALTTLNTPENRAKAAECGFDAYEVKLDRNSLLATVARLLKADRSTALARGRETQ